MFTGERMTVKVYESGDKQNINDNCKTGKRALQFPEKWVGLSIFTYLSDPKHILAQASLSQPQRSTTDGAHAVAAEQMWTRASDQNGQQCVGGHSRVPAL